MEEQISARKSKFKILRIGKRCMLLSGNLQIEVFRKYDIRHLKILLLCS